MPTGGYAYARRVLAEWQHAGIAADVVALPGSFPHPDAEALAATEAALDRGAPLLIDGLAYGALPEDLAAQIGPKAAVLLHHPLCDEQGLDAETASELEDNERRALAHAAAVIATSPSTARDLTARFAVPPESLTVAIPGTDPAPKSALNGDPPRLLAVGTVTPRKGYGVLVEALAEVANVPWHLDIHGAVDRHISEADDVREALESAGLSARVTLHGATTDAQVADAYRMADLFIAPSLHEGYGMAVVEAMAHGLPVVTTTAGALPDTAPCAVLVPPANARALADALAPLLTDAHARQELGETCRSFAETLPDWRETAERIAYVLETVE